MSQLDVKNGVENRVIDVHHNYQLTINDVNPWHLESGGTTNTYRAPYSTIVHGMNFVVVVFIFDYDKRRR